MKRLLASRLAKICNKDILIYYGHLLLNESVNDLTAILSEVLEHERDVHPAGAGLRILLPYQLVERQIVFDIVEPTSSFIYIAVDTEVSGLSLQVLTIIYTTNGLV